MVDFLYFIPTEVQKAEFREYLIIAMSRWKVLILINCLINMLGADSEKINNNKR